MKEIWYRLGSPLQTISIEFEGTLPTVNTVMTELNKRTELNHLFILEGKEDNYEFIEVSPEGKPAAHGITICFDYNTDSITVFYEMHLRYLPNAMIWVLRNLGGISPKKTPSWTRLKWGEVRWWHFATDVKFMTWRMHVLIAYTIIAFLAPIDELIRRVAKLFRGKNV